VRRSAPARGGCRLLALAALAAGCGDQGALGPPLEKTLDPTSLSASAADGEPGLATELVVGARDTEGRPFLGELPELELEIRGQNPGRVTAVANNGDGTHTLAYTPAEMGFDTLIVTLAGDTVSGTPLASRVRVVFVAATGTATVAGVAQASEWDATTEYDVFNGPTLTGSTARFMADATNLYVLVTYPDSIESATRVSTTRSISSWTGTITSPAG